MGAAGPVAGSRRHKSQHNASHRCGTTAAGQSKSADLLAGGGSGNPGFGVLHARPHHTAERGASRGSDCKTRPKRPPPASTTTTTGSRIAGTLTKAQNACLHDGGHVKVVGGRGEAAAPPPPPREHLRLVRPPAAPPRPPCERRGAEGDASSERCAATLEAGGWVLARAAILEQAMAQAPIHLRALRCAAARRAVSPPIAGQTV